MAVETSDKKIAHAERMKQALAMRRLGASLQKIGERLGVTRQAAHRLVSRALARLARETMTETKAWVAGELARLDAWQVTAESIRVNGSSHEVRLKAIAQLVKISERRARLLGIGSEAAPSASPSISINIDARERAKQVYGPALEGATLDEKRKMLEILKAARERQEALAAPQAPPRPPAPPHAEGPLAALPCPGNGHVGTTAEPYTHKPGNDTDGK